MRKLPPCALTVLLVPAVLLSACGQRVDLKPGSGAVLPPAPYGRADRPRPAELLQPEPQARPERSVELRRQSEVRLDDPFDLPPVEGRKPSPLPTPTATSTTRPD